MTFRPVEFGVTVRRHSTATRVCVRGELDLTTVGELDTVLRDHRGSGRSVILDLSELSFIGSTGLRVIMDAQTHANRDGWNLSLDPDVPDTVGRLLDLTGVRDTFRWLTA